MPGPVFRDGEVVELCPVETEDVPFVQRVVTDPRVRKGIAASEPMNRVQEREWVESLGDDDGASLLVCVEGDPVGTIGLKPPNEVWGTAEVGYMIDPAQWGNGYATDALRETCGYAFEERRLDKVYATAYATNPASCRVLETVGFEREGVLRDEGFVEGERVDVHRYGLLADEWLSA